MTRFTVKEPRGRVRVEVKELRRVLSTRLRFEKRLCRQWGAIEGSRAGRVTRAAS